MQRVVRSTLVGLLTLGIAGLSACGDKVTVPPANGPDSVVHSVTVTPSSVSLKVGDKVTLVASVDAGAGVSDRTVTWSSSNTAVASVDATSGLVTAVAGGNATIIAKSHKDPNVQGAAAVTVAAVVNAAVTVGQINQTVCVAPGVPPCSSIPANLGNVSGQLDVTLNVDPGTQTIAGVDLIMNCGGADTVVATQNLGSTDRAPIAAEDANAPVTLSFNTAAFNSTNGQVAFRNGACTIKGRVRTASGTQTASSTTALTLNNLDFVLASATTAPSTGQIASASDANGLQWRAGSVTVTAIPVVYTAGRSVVSGSISLVNVSGGNAQAPGNPILAIGNNGTLTTLSGLTPATGVLSASFPNTTDLTVSGAVGGVTAGSATGGVGFTVNTVDNNGNPGPAAIASASNSIRLDNRAPDVSTVPPTFIPGTQNTTGSCPTPTTCTTWAGANFAFTASGSTPSLTIDASTNNDAVAGIGVTGVDKNVNNLQWRPNGGSSTSWVTFTSVSSLSETSNTSGAGSNDFRLRICDALGNCANTGTLTSFGVDLTPPFITQVSGPANNAVYNGAGAPPNSVFSVQDTSKTAGVTASGPQVVGGVPQVLLSLQALKPNTTAGSTASVTVCDFGVPQGNAGSRTCKSPSLVSELAVPTTGTTDGSTANGEYTSVVTAVDQAGNTAPAISTKLYYDPTAPQISGGVAIPQAIIAGSSFTSGATDNMDVAAGNGYLNYPTAAGLSAAFRVFEGGSASPAGVTFDNVLTRSSTASTTLTPFYRSLGNVLNTTGPKPDVAGIRAIDAAGNLANAQVVTLPPTNITAPSSAPFTNTSTVNGILSWAITAQAPVNPVDTATNGTPLPITITATAQALNLTTASPFGSGGTVCFYVASPSGTEGGVAGIGGSAANELIQIGTCNPTPVTTIDGGGNRFLSYSTVWSPTKAFKTGTFQVYAIGNNAAGDGFITAASAVTIK